jgi:hypothetical protein
MNTAHEMYPMTAAEWLRRWDAGEGVWTIEMGGLGPGYEQAIQVCVAEIIRDNIDKPLPEGKFGEWGDATIERVDAKDPETGKYKLGGLSGAQVGAAKQLAFHFLANGPAKTLEKVDRDRWTQVSNFWPKAS